MATVTRIKLGADDHGRQLSYDDFIVSDTAEGYHYELIDGRLYVSPMPNLPENVLEDWLGNKLRAYLASHPEVINYVSTKARIFVPGRRRTTSPEPDLAAYRDFPLHLPRRQLRWQDVSPVLVAEIVSSDRDKDLVRNVALYLAVPSIREYWVVDPQEDPDRPDLRVYRRHGQRWRIIEVPFGQSYTTKLLPGFELIVDPRR